MMRYSQGWMITENAFKTKVLKSQTYQQNYKLRKIKQTNYDNNLIV
jgi:hypothetical protein